MNYSKIEFCDSVNGPGLRTTLFVSGCTHCCPNCHNKSTWNFKAGQEFTQETIDEIIESVGNPYIAGLSLSGGDPFHPRNTPTVLSLVKQFRLTFGKSKTIWAWTGYLLEELQERGMEYQTDLLLDGVDVLIDGPYIEALKDPSLQWRGSSNQRIINLKSCWTE